MKKILGSMVAVLIVLSLVIPVSQTVVEASNGFAGGSGTAGDPYQIADWHHLDNVRNHLGAHFILMNDLDADTDGYADLAGPNANEDEGWQPVGDLDNQFAGTFEGRGHEIRHLFINRPAQDYVGLFGVLGDTGQCSRISMVSVQITGDGRVASLIGHNRGSVDGCKVDADGGSVTGSEHVGGLVGTNRGSVNDSRSRATVMGQSFVGGLLAWNDGIVSNCYAAGTVNGNLCVGGLIGLNNDGTVCTSYATGNVIGTTDWYLGGLVGYNVGAIVDCFAIGNVSGLSGSSVVGGLAGRNDGIVRNCYSVGAASGADHVGGLVGLDSGTVADSFWDTEASGNAASNGGTGKTTAEMLHLDTFTDTATVGLEEPWDMVALAHGDIDPSSIWNIVDGRSYPFFGWLQLRFELKAGWNMVSVPRELPPGKNTVAEVFKGEIVAIYTWDPTTKSYTVPDTVEPYCGYWVAVTEDKTIAYLAHA